MGKKIKVKQTQNEKRMFNLKLTLYRNIVNQMIRQTAPEWLKKFVSGIVFG